MLCIFCAVFEIRHSAVAADIKIITKAEKR
jgi:hypothetical protein